MYIHVAVHTLYTHTHIRTGKPHQKNKIKQTRPRVPGNPIHGADPGVYFISITELHYRHIDQLPVSCVYRHDHIIEQRNPHNCSSSKADISRYRRGGVYDGAHVGFTIQSDPEKKRKEREKKVGYVTGTLFLTIWILLRYATLLLIPACKQTNNG